MFRQFADLREITSDLAGTYLDQIGRTAPVIGALRADAFLEKVASPPAPSPIAAHLMQASFATWSNLSRYLHSLRDMAVSAMGRRKFDAWCKRIEALCSDRERLLSLSVPLLLESQMNSVSPGAQDVLLSIMTPLAEASSSPLRHEGATYTPRASANATIVAVLHAGRLPFLLTCHTAQTMTDWWSHMEAATVLLLPQIVVEVEPHLSPRHQKAMFSAIRDELRVWRRHRPAIGDNPDWGWLPRLI